MRPLSTSATRLALTLALAGVAAPPSHGQTRAEPVVVAQSYTLASQILGQERRINVYLPPGTAPGDRLPVLYLLDGGVEEDFLHVMGLASLAADFRRIRPFAVVGIEGIDRYHDLTPPSSVPEDRERLPTAGGAAAFRRFLGQELQPWVRAHLPVGDESVLAGESVAGLFVIETLLREPGLFGGYVAVSPSLWWNGGALAREAPALLGVPGFPADRRLYLALADEGGETQQAVETLVAALRESAPAGLDWDYQPMSGESHGTIFHPAALAAVRRLFATRGPEG